MPSIHADLTADLTEDLTIQEFRKLKTVLVYVRNIC